MNNNDLLNELKKWCNNNYMYQEGMDDDGGFYDSMNFIILEDIIERIDEYIEYRDAKH